MSAYGLRSYLETSRQVARRHGDASLAVLLRMLAAKAAYGLSASEYGLYALHDRPGPTLRTYMTKKQTTELFAHINPDVERPAVEDKLDFHRRCTAAGLPTPPLHAVLCRGGRDALDDVPALTGFRDVVDRLTGAGGAGSTRLILKPRRDALGTGVRFVELRAGGPVDIRGQPLDLARFEADLQADMQRDNYLVQSFVRPHPVTASWGAGRALGTLRIVTFVQGNEVRLLYALVRIPCGDNVHDNFSGGGSGNLIASVDIASGQLQRAFGRRDRLASRLLESFDHNPDTGRPIAGETVPDWDAVRATVRCGAHAFRSLPLLGWDIALAADSVVVIEANSNPDIIGAQVSSGFGARELRRPLGS